MALEGSLKEFGLADILQLIYFQRKTGILSLDGRMDKVRLLFYEGNIVSAESKRRAEANRLGKVLVKKGIIKEEDLQRSLEEQQETGIKLGNILIKNKLVQKEQVQEILTAQITETVTQLFAWKEGMYEFSPQGVPFDKDIPVSLDTQHLLMDGLRIIDEWSLIEGKLTLDSVFEKTGKSTAELTQEEKEMLELVDGESDVSSIVDSSDMDSFQASKTLVSLLEKDAIEPRESKPVAAEIVMPSAVPSKRELALPSFIAPVIFLISLIVSLIPLFLQKAGDTGKFKASAEIDKVRFMIEISKYENNTFPDALDKIANANDIWGRPYVYKTDGQSFTLFSTGPDAKEGTEDDIY